MPNAQIDIHAVGNSPIIGAANRVNIDLSRPAAKAQLALLLANEHAGRNIDIDVNDSCLFDIS